MEEDGTLELDRVVREVCEDVVDGERVEGTVVGEVDGETGRPTNASAGRMRNQYGCRPQSIPPKPVIKPRPGRSQSLLDEAGMCEG